MKRLAMLIVGLCCVAGAADSFTSSSTAKLWLPDLVSTANTEVRITFSPDGQRMLWGTIGWSGGVGGWDIFESVRNGDGWSQPAPVVFNSSANDFDPSFAPDGSGVYFFSNRVGGFGKDDLYFAAFDVEMDRYDAAVNLGAAVNTAGEEWAHVLSLDGKQLLFASDGHGGKGKHDLFIAHRAGERWTEPRNVEALNSPQEDFDAAFLEDGRSIVFSRGDLEGSVVLYVSRYLNEGLQPPVRLDESVNSKQKDAWTFGPSISAHDRGALYVTSQREDHKGKADIYRIEYRLAK